MTKPLRRWLSFGVTVAVLALIVYNFSRNPEWRHFNWDRFVGSFLHAKWGYLIAAATIALATYLIRAVRWRYFMDPVKQASLWVLFCAQVLGFSSVYLIGRVGELIRPAYVARIEKVSFSSMIAVLVLERIYDTFAMVILFVLAVHTVPLHLTGRHAAEMFSAMHEGGQYLLVGISLALVFLIFLRLRAAWIENTLGRYLGFLPPRLKVALRGVFDHFVDGLGAIRNWKDLSASLVSTALLWFCNVAFIWLVFHSLGGRLNLSFMASVLLLFSVALGLLVQVPGLGGGVQLAVIGSLTYLFAVPKEDATGASMLLWIVMLAPCLASALAILLYQGLSFKKLRHMAEEQEMALHQRV